MLSDAHDTLEPDLVMTASLWTRLRAHLLRPSQRHWFSRASPQEHLAFMLASGNLNRLRWRLLVRELLLAGPDDLARQSATGITPKPEFVMAALNRCRKEGLHLIEVHSHPFAHGSGTTFSPLDWRNDLEKMPAVALLLEDFMHATMVVGQDSLDAHVYDRTTGQILPLRRVTIVGCNEDEKSSAGLRSIPTTGNLLEQKRGDASVQQERYHRQELFFGHETQQHLRHATVAIVGLGGLGSFVAYELAHLGIGHLIFIDPDRVDQSNLNRLLGAGPADIGRAKVEVYAELLQRLSPTTHITALPFPIIAEAALAYARGADVLVGCVDNHGARLILNQLAIRYLIPLVDGGSGIQPATGQTPLQAGGQVQVVLPGSGCLECRGFIDMQRAASDLATLAHRAEERARGYGLDEPAPAVIYLNGIIASAQVAEVVSLLADTVSPLPRSRPPIVLYDVFDRSMLVVEPHPSTDCVTCGQAGALALGDLAPLRPAVPSGPRVSIPASQREAETPPEIDVPEAGALVPAETATSTLELK